MEYGIKKIINRYLYLYSMRNNEKNIEIEMMRMMQRKMMEEW